MCAILSSRRARAPTPLTPRSSAAAARSRTAADIAEERGLRCTVGNLLSSDTFYDDDKTANAAWIKMGVLGIEMEAAALYLNAMRAGKKALTICTVSDHVITGEETTAEERQNSFREMMELALEVAVRS